MARWPDGQIWPKWPKWPFMAIWPSDTVQYHEVQYNIHYTTPYADFTWTSLRSVCRERLTQVGWSSSSTWQLSNIHFFFTFTHIIFYILYLAHSSRVDHLPTRSFNFFQTHFHTLLQVVHLIRSDLRERSKYNCMWERSPGYQAEDFPELEPHTAAQDRRGETSWKPMLTWHCI